MKKSKIEMKKMEGKNKMCFSGTTETHQKRCVVCGHIWIARVPMPIQCPRCKSNRWYRPPKPSPRPTEQEIQELEKKRSEDIIIVEDG